VRDGQASEQRVPGGGDFDQDFPMIKDVAITAHQAEGGEPVDELDDGVMFELELPGEGADRRKAVGGQPLDRKKELVLLGLEPGLPRGLFAEDQEAAEEMAKIGQILIIGLTQPSFVCGHFLENYIVLRYKVNRKR
jgi:hypothetical protein